MTVYLASNIQLLTASSKFKFLLPYKYPPSRDIIGLIFCSTFRVHIVFVPGNLLALQPLLWRLKRVLFDWSNCETREEAPSHLKDRTGKPAMSYPDSENLARFAAGASSAGSSQQPYPGTGMDPGLYHGFPMPFYNHTFPMPLPMMPPYPTPPGIYPPAPLGTYPPTAVGKPD